MFKHLRKKLIFTVLCILLVCSIQASSACTSVYVGSDVSADGSVIFSRSNDNQDVAGNHITVTPRVENQPDRFMPINHN